VATPDGIVAGRADECTPREMDLPALEEAAMIEG
jgi:hypothetical protein